MSQGSVGSVTAIFICDQGSGPMRSVDRVNALAGRGLEGDRYASGTGTYSRGEAHQQVTLIESEAVEAVRRDHEIDLDASETRRNIVTSGIALNHRVGQEFSVGGARVRGIRLCEPCGHIEKLSGKAVCRPLIHRGGLRCEIVSGGPIAIGDAVT